MIWFHLYKPVVVLMLRLNTTAKDNDEDDQYSPFFNNFAVVGVMGVIGVVGVVRYGWKEPLNVCAKTRMI